MYAFGNYPIFQLPILQHITLRFQFFPITLFMLSVPAPSFSSHSSSPITNTDYAFRNLPLSLYVIYPPFSLLSCSPDAGELREDLILAR